MTLRRFPVVAVFGSGSLISAERATLARTVGAMVARLGAHLLTGGGYGVMAAASEGFVAVEERRGLSLGIIPCAAGGPFDRPHLGPDGSPYPNQFVEIAIHAALPASSPDWRREPGRNHVNVLSAHAVIALPGSAGTRNELDMMAWFNGEAAATPAERRTVLIGPREEFTAEHLTAFVHAESVAAARRHVARILHRDGHESDLEP